MCSRAKESTGVTSVNSPFDQASVWSKMSFWWMNSLFRVGFKRRLEPEDIFYVPVDDEARISEQRLTKFWNRETTKQNPSLFRTVLMAFRWSWVLPGFLIFVSESIKMLQPFFIGQLIAYFSPSSKMSETEAYLYAASLGASALVQVFCNPLYFFLMAKVGMRMRTATAGLIYRKLLTLSCQSFSSTSSGKIVNLLSTDIEKLINGLEHIHDMWVSPINIILSSYLLYKMVGVAFLFGIAVIVLLIPAHVAAGHVFGKLRLKIGAWSDKRIHMMTEILSGMRVIKMYCWEKPFSNLINYLRNKEIQTLKLAFLLRALSHAAGEVSPRLMVLLMFVGHWLLGYPPLPLQNIFMSLGWLVNMKLSGFIFLYSTVQYTSELMSSLSRIQVFLSIDGESRSDQPFHKVNHTVDPESDLAFEVVDVSASWNSVKERDASLGEESVALVEMEPFLVDKVNLKVKKGELLAVVGRVGAGKSSLLSILLEELSYSQGQITLNGSLSYSCQQPWVYSGTVRENILFGDNLDTSRYEAVIEACALSKDISHMPYGDQTLVGERGLLLSGGQKARLTLARAVYRERDIYLLDDPLSAVDTKVGKQIFNKCICDLLNGKTRVLVTHQLQYLQAADRIVVMGSGQIVDVGNYDDFMSRNHDLSSAISSHDNGTSDDSFSIDDPLMPKFKLSDTTEILEAESRGSGSVRLYVYSEYLKAAKAVYFIPAILLFCTIAQSIHAYNDWLLAKWTEAIYPVLLLNTSANSTNSSLRLTAVNYTNDESFLSRNWSTMVPEMRLYITTFAVYFVCVPILCVLLFQMTAVASQNLHNQMFRYVLGSRSKFFDENPVGRILNRFARDIGFLDSMTAWYLIYITTIFFDFLMALAFTLLVSPWLLIPIIPVLIFIVMIRHYAVHTTREVRRLEGLARSPVYSHVSDTISGLQTIRAMKKEDQFYNEFVKCQNTHTSAWFTYICSYRWFGIRTIFLLAIYTTIATFVCVALGNTIPRELLGLALIYCSALGEPFEFFMRLTAELENLMTSTERIVSYTTLDQEGPVTTATPPPSSWPPSGSITFKGTSLRYSQGGTSVLKQLNFTIKPKEKIGIVGRTGAGKSSLLAALFRLTEPEGAIIVDDIDIMKIGLKEIRCKLSVIPQDPVIFTGTLRRNLDPFEEFRDDVIWATLQQVQLRDKVTSSPGQLDMEVIESGSNFSVGERQLICLARALLRNNKILILDEATANVDNKTDNLIQRTIREHFKDCTVLTIAHRLHTVMDYDKILVMDEGIVQEFDVPYVLLQNKDGFLYKLVHQMGPNHREHLLSLVPGNTKLKDV